MDKFYDSLKSTPLAQDRETGSLEEAAIWLDMNANDTSSIVKILKAIEKNYHRREDDLVEDGNYVMRHLHSIAMTARHQSLRLPLIQICCKYFSDSALFWLFKTIKETNALDKAVLCKKFMSYAMKARDKHRENIKKAYSIGAYKTYHISGEDEALYEVFAELVDILDEKLASHHEVK